ncbi:MAG TPA: DUF434 domain-containing protein [Oscillospiraceae bacterium]|mgnify:CR=1 FL=1|nr:DUF434 domain-containing protein [Oscillospiraceae bacterium]HPS34808.1 DUF434 domain-containing protein [Oscillospiraceae bacterium]
MCASVKRGYYPSDKINFSGSALGTLNRAAEELFFLLNRGYPAKSASAFIGNHYLLPERGRVALTRAVASEKDIAARKAKQRGKVPEGETVHIDGFNQIITLEVALSGSPVIACMDGTYRDLAGLRGTYRLIDKTDTAIKLIFSALREFSAQKAVFLLDKPISNSGRLKTRIAEIAEEEQFETEIELADKVDQTLYELSNVVTSDSVILDRCESWLNLNEILIPAIQDIWIIKLQGYILSNKTDSI